jgi:hypothetical protein
MGIFCCLLLEDSISIWNKYYYSKMGKYAIINPKPSLEPTKVECFGRAALLPAISRRAEALVAYDECVDNLRADPGP